MKRILVVFPVLILGVILTAAGCGSKKEQAPQAGEKPIEVVIGYTGPLSGPAAEYGQDCLNGIDMAVNEINSAGGITVGGKKYMFRLEKLDDMADPTNAVNNARRLRNQFKAPAVFNPVFNTIAPMMQINQEKGNEFIIMAYTSTPKVVQLNNKLVVAIPPPFTAYVQSFTELAMSQGWKKAGLVVTLGAYGDEWRQAFKDHWTRKGGVITADKPANYYTETDFSSQLTAVLATQPDVLLIGGPSASTALVIEQARGLGFKGGFILVDQAKMDYIDKNILKGIKLMENTIGVAAVAQIPTPTAPAFDKKYSEAYKRMNTWESALNYCAMHALARAMAAAGSVEDAPAIRAAFPKAFPLTGDKFPSEFFDISDKGRMHCMASVQMIKDGKYSPADLYAYWQNDQADFEKLKAQVKITGGTVKYLKVEE
ncbi:MAG: ABC transporter substrate-binding protein [Peptococcaceae bacterium]|nr:ABC transporter substrate-binding protein [Peptococcaceae bacterium]